MSGLAFSSYPVTEVKNLRFQCSQPALHDHPFHQLFVLTRGGGTHSLDGETLEVHAPVVLVAPKGRPHLYMPSAEAEGWSLGFTDALVPQAANLLFLTTVTCAGIPLSAPEVAQRLVSLARLIHEQHWSPTAADPIVQSHLLAAFLLILQREYRSQPARALRLPPADRILTERFMGLLDQACRNHWETARFARELHCSRRKLLGICQQALDLPLHAALQEHRMRQARARLVQGQESIQQIAMDLGYPDPSYFAKAFRRVMGLTPTDYRNARLDPDGSAPVVRKCQTGD